MNRQIIDLNHFETDQSLGEGLELVITIKSFELQKIRDRYLKSKQNKGNKRGSVERRPPAWGGVAHLIIGNGKVIKHDMLAKLLEPRAIDVRGDRLLIGSENKLYVFDNAQAEPHILEDPWFSYIHTSRFSPFNQSDILVASSGLDILIEKNYLTQKTQWEWCSWEHGFDQAIDPKTGAPVLLTRSPQLADKYFHEGISHILIDRPLQQVLPTAKRAAFINSIEYNASSAGLVTATFFHEGSVYSISKTTQKATKLLDGLKSPHGGMEAGESVWATSTAHGTFHLLKKDQLRIFDFQNLPGKDIRMGDAEWVQNTIHIDQNLFVAIDSNRTCLVFFDVERHTKSMVPFDLNWAVQDIIVLRSMDEKSTISYFDYFS